MLFMHISRFRASLYPCPETAAERREVAIGVETRIEDLQNVRSTRYTKIEINEYFIVISSLFLQDFYQ